MSYIRQYPGVIFELLLEHLNMTIIAIFVAIVIAFAIALLVNHYRWMNGLVMGFLGIVYTIPSLALIILLVPKFGLNRQSVIIAMILYTQVILLRNFLVGFKSIDPAIIEAARGMGMNAWQRVSQVQMPLILPIFVAGVRLASIVAVAIATIGAKFGAGGLGVLLFDGVSQARNDKIFAGAIAVALLALAINGILLGLEWLSSPARKIQQAASK